MRSCCAARIFGIHLYQALHGALLSLLGGHLDPEMQATDAEQRAPCCSQAEHIQHLTRLQTLQLVSGGSEIYESDLDVHLQNLPPTVQRLSGEGTDLGVHVCSWPTAGQVALIRLSSYEVYLEEDENGQPWQPAWLACCRLELQARQLTIYDSRWPREQLASMPLAHRLLNWVEGSHADTVLMEAGPTSDFDELPLRVAVWHENISAVNTDSVEINQLLGALQLRCGSHGLSCRPGEAPHSACFSRKV